MDDGRCPRDWIVVTDGASARVLVSARAPDRLREVARVGATGEALRAGSRPEQGSPLAVASHLVEAGLDARRPTRRCLRCLRESLGRALRDGDLRSVVLICPRELSAPLRDGLGARLSARVRATVHRDLVGARLSTVAMVLSEKAGRGGA